MVNSAPSASERKFTELTERILAILEECPSGLTARDVAKALGTTVGNASSRLSKLAAYGVIEKRRIKPASNIPVISIYRPPQARFSELG